MVIDLRSDTVTRPTAAMAKAMMEAPVGDDVFGEDPSVNQLEALAAEMFGMEAALFCASGTMSNQAGIRAHTQPGDEVVCEETAHVYQYEGGGIAVNAGCQVKLIPGNRGRITAAQVLGAINPDDVHKPITRLVCLENTSNRGGGSCYDQDTIMDIRQVCDKNGLLLHLDGARLWNAMVAKNESPRQYGQLFHSISVCLNKGLGCPMGSILLGNKDFIRRSRRIRKVMGGGLRQAGYMAACGIYALNNHVQRLEEDHRHAVAIAEALSANHLIKEVMPVETNIIIACVKEKGSAASIVDQLKNHGVLGYAMTADQLRLVLHLDISDKMVDQTIKAIKTI